MSTLLFRSLSCFMHLLLLQLKFIQPSKLASSEMKVIFRLLKELHNPQRHKTSYTNSLKHSTKGNKNYDRFFDV